MAFAGIGALSGAAFSRGITVDIGWRSHRIFNGALQPFPFVMALGLGVLAFSLAFTAWRQRWRDTRLRVAIGVIVVALALEPLFAPHTIEATPRPLPFVLDILLGACVACFLAVLVGTGALRVKGLLLAISTMAFAIAAQDYLFGRPIFSGSEGSLTVNFSRGKIGPIDLNYLNRNYYYFVLICLVIVLAVAGHLRRTGVGRSIIGVRENEPGGRAHGVAGEGEAHRVRARRVHLRPRRRAARRPRRDHRVHRTVLHRSRLPQPRGDRGNRRSRQPHRRGHGRAVGRRAAHVLAQQPDRAVAHVEHRVADRVALLPGRLLPDRLLTPRITAQLAREAPARARAQDEDGAARIAQARSATPGALTLNADGSASRPAASPSATAGSSRSTTWISTPIPAR